MGLVGRQGLQSSFLRLKDGYSKAKQEWVLVREEEGWEDNFHWGQHSASFHTLVGDVFCLC